MNYVQQLVSYLSMIPCRWWKLVRVNQNSKVMFRTTKQWWNKDEGELQTQLINLYRCMTASDALSHCHTVFDILLLQTIEYSHFKYDKEGPALILLTDHMSNCSYKGSDFLCYIVLKRCISPNSWFLNGLWPFLFFAGCTARQWRTEIAWTVLFCSKITGVKERIYVLFVSSESEGNWWAYWVCLNTS